MVTSTDGTGNRKFHIAVVSRQFKIHKKPPLSKKSGLIILLVLLLGVGATAGYTAVHNYQVKRAKIDQAKVISLMKVNNCSSSAVNSVSAERPNTNNIEGSIVLLSYRQACQTLAGNYKEANKTLDQLKTYYQMQNDTVAVNNIEQQISSNNYATEHPITHTVNIPPEISPNDISKIKAVFGTSK